MNRPNEFLTIGKPKIVLDRNDGTSLLLELTDYAFLLREAKKNGWNPEGYEKVSRTGDGVFKSVLASDYLFPQIGRVSDRDAKNIAKALRKIDTPSEKFINREVFKTEFYHVDELFDFDFVDFIESCCTASEVILSMGGFFVVSPQNMAQYLNDKKKKVFEDFTEFCELGGFHYLQIINEWYETNIQN